MLFYNNNFSKNYTYQVVSRVKRGAKEILDVLMKGFEFRFEAPGIEWDKTIGSKDIGASMGLTIRNLIDLKLSMYFTFFSEKGK